ncbi:MAG: head GIN domain-containing protein [Bacteroidota bacterium]
MKTLPFIRSFIVLTLLMFTFTACERDDPGPYRSGNQTYNYDNFDQLDMGDAFEIHVQQGSNFSIQARGDQRNLRDLDIWASNGTLHARYRHNRNRQYETKFDITMPSLYSVDFSGASSSTIVGFNDQEKDLDVKLSGASRSEISLQARQVNADLSGASELLVSGIATYLKADLSGASELRGFNLTTPEAEIEASGASLAQVKVSTYLKVKASGDSKVRYLGNPQLNVRVSGGSQVQPD